MGDFETEDVFSEEKSAVMRTGDKPYDDGDSDGKVWGDAEAAAWDGVLIFDENWGRLVYSKCDNRLTNYLSST